MWWGGNEWGSTRVRNFTNIYLFHFQELFFLKGKGVQIRWWKNCIIALILIHSKIYLYDDTVKFKTKPLPKYFFSYCTVNQYSNILSLKSNSTNFYFHGADYVKIFIINHWHTDFFFFLRVLQQTFWVVFILFRSFT